MFWDQNWQILSNPFRGENVTFSYLDFFPMYAFSLVINCFFHDLEIVKAPIYETGSDAWRCEGSAGVDI